jgi:hypothetical protein
MLLEQLSFRGAVKVNKINHGPIHDTGIHVVGGDDGGHNRCCKDKCEDVKHKKFEEKAGEKSLYLLPQNSSEEEKDERVDGKGFLFERSEIINKLFPMGYPSSQATQATQAKEDIIDTSEHCDSSEEICREETYRSPFHRSEVINSLFPFGYPGDQEKKECEVNSDFVKTERTSLHAAITKETNNYTGEHQSEKINDGHDSDEETSVDQNRDKLIGLEIIFDPTWDLLAPEEPDNMASMVKARLRKFHEVENYADSLLGKYLGEEASEESTDLLADTTLRLGIEPMPLPQESESVTTEEISSDAFELGYHFDTKRFPLVDSSEVEICFYADEALNECLDEITIAKSCKTPRETEDIMFFELFDFVFSSEESRDDVHVDEIDSTFSGGGKLFLDESIDYGDSDCNVQSPILPLVTTTISPPLLPSTPSPKRGFSPHNFYLFTDKNQNERIDYESSSISGTEIATKQLRKQQCKSIYMPVFGSSCSTTANPSDPTIIRE